MPWRKARAASTNWANTLPGTPGWAKPALEQFFASQCALYRSEEDRYFQFEAYRRLFAQVLNWRSYLLGADGQGVEHSNVQDEAIRMALLLNYAAADRHGRVPVASLENAQRLLVQLGSAYWEETIGAVDLAGAPIGTESCSASKGSPPRLGRAHLHPQQLRSDR